MGEADVVRDGGRWGARGGGRLWHGDGLCCCDWPNLGVANVFALLRLLPMSSRDKDAEILALRHQRSPRTGTSSTS